MTQKDIFKILLCSYGYDRNIKINKYYGEGGFIGYEIYAENEEGDYFEEENCEGFMFHIYCILDYMKENNVGFKSNYWNLIPKDVTDDNSRNALIATWDRNKEEIQQRIIKDKPIEEWKNKNNPCPSCTINKKDHWDSIHYNCELCHTHSCDIMIKFWKDVEKMREGYPNTTEVI